MTNLSPTQQYWLGWAVLGLVFLVAEFYVIKWAVIAAYRTTL